MHCYLPPFVPNTFFPLRGWGIWEGGVWTARRLKGRGSLMRKMVPTVVVYEKIAHNRIYVGVI